MKKVSYTLFAASLILLLIYPRYTKADESEGAGQKDARAIKEVNATGAHMLIEKNRDNPDFIILDVRTAEEYSDGHIENSLNLDYKSDSFKDEVGKLDKSKTYLVHCRSGRRSEAASKIMEETGFLNIYELDGGIKGWEETGFPVTK
ncbi:MAG: rhodanese-like domain-containing protein [Deltaproteobacteria bacterium]